MIAVIIATMSEVGNKFYLRYLRMKEEIDVRIDKWLWAVRIYKTRGIAVDEINKGRVMINGMNLKPSRIVKVGELITVRKPPVIYTYKVIGIIHNRVSAQLAKDYVENLTSDEEILKLSLSKIDLGFQRDKGTGRPTKRERRTLDKFREDE